MKFLIVVDMQNDFVTGPLGSAAACKARDNIEAYLKNLDDKTYVIFTRDTHEENYLDTLEGKMLPVPHCKLYTEGWEVDKRLAEVVADRERLKYADKFTFGAVYLHNSIRNVCCFYEEKIDEAEIEICGVCTDICVVSNALLLRAQFPNMKISVLRDLCAGTSTEAHQAALTVMGSCQIEVI
jgi:nicotinamidase-related amidase